MKEFYKWASILLACSTMATCSVIAKNRSFEPIPNLTDDPKVNNLIYQIQHGNKITHDFVKRIFSEFRTINDSHEIFLTPNEEKVLNLYGISAPSNQPVWCERQNLTIRSSAGPFITNSTLAQLFVDPSKQHLFGNVTKAVDIDFSTSEYKFKFLANGYVVPQEDQETLANIINKCRTPLAH